MRIYGLARVGADLQLAEVHIDVLGVLGQAGVHSFDYFRLVDDNRHVGDRDLRDRSRGFSLTGKWGAGTNAFVKTSTIQKRLQECNGSKNTLNLPPAACAPAPWRMSV